MISIMYVKRKQNQQLLLRAGTCSMDTYKQRTLLFYVPFLKRQTILIGKGNDDGGRVRV